MKCYLRFIYNAARAFKVCFCQYKKIPTSLINVCLILMKTAIQDKTYSREYKQGEGECMSVPHLHLLKAFIDRLLCYLIYEVHPDSSNSECSLPPHVLLWNFVLLLCAYHNLPQNTLSVPIISLSLNC